ncbi:hypothetical protein GCE86_28895 [Micromonospora terminaliae]|uniref:PH domain-containing protein n=1 Tax=Micromonospora terminaliae TaxID=1914461 RepID=A0AAJ2ZAD6_9ACTN|nr:hypothetical protein [Micromonospora terminaliae]NES26517.1 hypothetical protein [Micromonospora terminaliae]QGL50690.1 hypothetical protein GCE86_28895 [Micromonospora terminaliae]
MQEIIAGALRRRRTAAVIAPAVGFGGGLLSRWADAAGGAVGLLTLVPPVLLLVLSIRELVRRPGTAELRIDETARAFFSPPNRALTFPPILCGWLVFMAVDSAHRAGDDPLRWTLVTVYAVLCLAIAAGHWRRLPFVALTAAGVTYGAPRPLAVVPWEALGGELPVGPGASGRYLRLPIVRPDLVRRAGRGPRPGVFVAVRELTVAPALLAVAIQHYATHPQHRAAIGTPEEYTRLRHALTAVAQGTA